MTNEQILQCVDSVFDEAVNIRRFLHENPEIGNREFTTTEYIVSLLEKWNIEVQRPLETGAVGVLSCGEGKTVVLRADIDALPVEEKTGLPFASKNEGMMHACGHDIHTASLLAAAKILSEHRDELHGTVKFVFQPDEEGFGGAKRLIDAGVLDSPRADKVFGIHIRPELPAGKIAVKYGKSYAASDIFTITVKGKSAHGAQPDEGVNALTAASRIALALEGIVARTTSPTDSAVVSVCTFESGTACNIIPDEAVLTGIIRTLGPQTRSKMKQQLISTAEEIAKATGCTAEVGIRESYPGVVNHDGDVAFVSACARELYGDDNLVVLDEPTMTTEDFGYYLENTDGCFYHIGAGTPYPLHNGKMSPDEQCIKSAIGMHVELVLAQ
ncbi:MAG: M20 family metallopeptidase [Faecalibacterium sp.]|nr:M20 family metallopeptidase [Ruminococcus sp.]MCM1392393.1 M20 family metallopeptidase [Ruminococcus sp.]MCM1485901.1 M20 family metallopeptidase [Faecalibacterium sp.]